MFGIEQGCEQYVIADAARNSLHSNGKIYLHCFEYFPTYEDAQAVLDKFYPKPQHVWEHGDVFESGYPANQGIMMYIHQDEGHVKRPPQVIYLNDDTYTFSPPEKYLKGAKLLFNIKEKI